MNIICELMNAGLLGLNTHRNAQTRSGGRLWGCNWGVTGLVYFWSMCCSGAGPNSWACASTRASRDVCPSSNDQMQVSDNQHGHLLTFSMSSTSPCSVCACVCSCAVCRCASLSLAALKKPQTSIAEEGKTTKSSSLSLCDSLWLLPKQIGLACRSPLHQLSGWKKKKKKETGRCSCMDVCNGTTRGWLLKGLSYVLLQHWVMWPPTHSYNVLNTKMCSKSCLVWFKFKFQICSKVALSCLLGFT